VGGVRRYQRGNQNPYIEEGNRKAITSKQSIDTGNIGHTKHIAKTNKSQNNIETKR
jgi:hypothetical protein